MCFCDMYSIEISALHLSLLFIISKKKAVTDFIILVPHLKFIIISLT